MPVFDHHRLAILMNAVLTGRGVNPASAAHVVDSLILTSLRGVDSHGINLFPYYCRTVDGGRINKTPDIRIVGGGESAVVIDADDGFGHHAGRIAIAAAVERARRFGTAAVSVRKSSHFGAAAYFTLPAARVGMIGFAFTNTEPIVRAPASALGMFGTNPIACAAPMAGEEPFCLDMATSIVPFNKIMNHRRSGQPIPPAWGCDEKGAPTTDAKALVNLNPIGDYKGFGLGMMVEILCGLLGAGPAGREVPMFADVGQPNDLCHFFAAIDIAHFLDPAVFRTRLSEVAATLRTLPKAGDAPSLTPGDPEKANFSDRCRTGIPVGQESLAEFLAIDAGFARALRPL